MLSAPMESFIYTVCRKNELVIIVRISPKSRPSSSSSLFYTVNSLIFIENPIEHDYDQKHNIKQEYYIIIEAALIAIEIATERRLISLSLERKQNKRHHHIKRREEKKRKEPAAS